MDAYIKDSGQQSKHSKKTTPKDINNETDPLIIENELSIEVINTDMNKDKTPTTKGVSTGAKENVEADQMELIPITIETEDDTMIEAEEVKTKERRVVTYTAHGSAASCYAPTSIRSTMDVDSVDLNQEPVISNPKDMLAISAITKSTKERKSRIVPTVKKAQTPDSSQRNNTITQINSRKAQ